MRRLAVTGTNGKTSTVEFCRQLLARSGVRAASYGTLGMVTDAGRDPNPSTAVGPWALPAFLMRLETAETDVVALEAFSSLLADGMFEHVSVDIAAFTNLDRDHLDVHGDVAAYFAAKRRLFAEVLATDGTAVLNRDDERAGDLLDCCRDRGVDVTTYGWHDKADITVRTTSPSATGTVAALTVFGQSARVAFGLMGDVMVSNACCALAMALATGIPVGDGLAGLERLRAPPGRIERMGAVDGAEVFVDYAHTPAALQAVLETLRPRANGDLIVVFGCGGDRDPGKRRLMGKVATTHADGVIVTDDNPRNEDPASIRATILTGCPDAEEIGDRRAAITRAVEGASSGDVIVIAGKGHERTQVVGDETRAFSDHDVVHHLTSPART